MALHRRWPGWLASAGEWLTSRPAYMLLTADEERLAEATPRRFLYAWAGLMLLSLGWGALIAGVWGWAWFLFKEPQQILFTCVAVTTALYVLWGYRRAFRALAELLGGPDPTGRALAAALLVVGFALCLLGLQSVPFHNESRLPAALAWLRPAAELHRVLLIMPLWGAWAMLITGQLWRPDDRTEPAVVAFVRGCGPLPAAASMALPAVLTWLYFRYLGGWELSLWAAAVVAAVAGGLGIAHLTGGLKRRTLLAVNLLTQCAFLLAYLANR